MWKFMARCFHSLLQKFQKIWKGKVQGKGSSSEAKGSLSIPLPEAESGGGCVTASSKQVKQLCWPRAGHTKVCNMATINFGNTFYHLIYYSLDTTAGLADTISEHIAPAPALLGKPPCAQPQHRSRKQHSGCRGMACWEVSLCHIWPLWLP